MPKHEANYVITNPYKIFIARHNILLSGNYLPPFTAELPLYS